MFLLSMCFLFQSAYMPCFKSYKSIFFFLQMLSMTLSLLVPLQPTFKALSVEVYSVSSADMKQRKRGRGKKAACKQEHYDVSRKHGQFNTGHLLWWKQACIHKRIYLGHNWLWQRNVSWPVDLIFQDLCTYCQAMLNLDWSSTMFDSSIWLEAAGTLENIPYTFCMFIFLQLPQLPAGAHS